MPIVYEEPAWWPPKIGDKLRHFTLHDTDDDVVQHVHALAHVLAVFEHNDRTLATVAEWFPGKHRWNYETISGFAARTSYWPDGQKPPETHENILGRALSCCMPKVR